LSGEGGEAARDFGAEAVVDGVTAARELADEEGDAVVAVFDVRGQTLRAIAAALLDGFESVLRILTSWDRNFADLLQELRVAQTGIQILFAFLLTLPFSNGFPVYYQNARAYIMLIDPARQEFVPGEDKTGEGTALNVRALYQRCPHLGCKPNPCIKNYWFECPCHGSRYDRLGIKAQGAQYGPAPRGMDRFSITVKADGTLVLDTSKITLGPLPVAVGQPGIIPPKSPVGCI